MSGAVHSERFYFPFKHFQNEAGALEVGPSFESVCLWESEAECQQTQVRRFYMQMIFMCWMLMLNSRKTGSVKKKVEDSRFGFIPDVHHRRHMKTPNEKLKALQI